MNNQITGREWRIRAGVVAVLAAALAAGLAGAEESYRQQEETALPPPAVAPVQTEAPAAHPQESVVPVHEFHLDNGLKLLVKEDHRAPVVVSQVWYRVGSGNEHTGSTGISHMLEHMMFKGTALHPAGELSHIIAANGGSENAFTGRDYTAYFQSLENTRLEISFALESDRMRNLLLPPEEFTKEHQVVMEERRLRTDDNPRALTQEQLVAAAFVNSPYHWTVIGWMGDIEGLTVDDVRTWYQRWYAPNNATVVVVGDVQPKDVAELAKRYFGPLTSGSAQPISKNPVEPTQHGERRIIVKAPARLPSILMGYHVPVLRGAATSWEPYALEVLAHILDGDSSSRFSRELVRGSEVAATVGAGYDLYARLPDLFTLGGTPSQGKDIKTLEMALREQVRRVREEPVNIDELERVKVQAVADNIYERDSVFYQAMQIGMLDAAGLDWRLADEYVERIRAVTAEQIQAVAHKYLLDDHLTVAVLDPQPLESGHPISDAPVGGSHVR
ncbi:zinc protease [Gammaproteobacteria bacterium]